MSALKAMVSVCVLVAVLAGAVAAQEFTLMGDEHKNVTTQYWQGWLYDFSSASILSGGEVRHIDAYNNSGVDISGGSVGDYGGGLSAYDSSSVNMSSGDVFVLNAYASSSVTMSGGKVGQQIDGGLFAYDTSTVDISGGEVTQLGVQGNRSE